MLVLISAEKNAFLCTVSLSQNPRTVSDCVYARPCSNTWAQEAAMLKLAQQSFISILGAEDGVKTIQLQEPRVGDKWSPRERFGCY